MYAKSGKKVCYGTQMFLFHSVPWHTVEQEDARGFEKIKDFIEYILKKQNVSFGII